MVRKITGLGMAPAFQSDLSWDLEDSIFDEISKSCRIKLSAKMREKVNRIVMHHISAANLAVNAPRAGVTFARMNKMQKSADALLPALKNLANEPFDIIKSALSRMGFIESKLKLLISDLEDFSKCCIEAHDLMTKHVVGGTGSERHPHLEQLVWGLAHVFEQAGGNASAAYSPNARRNSHDEGRRNGPFVRFVFRLTKELPRELQLPSAGLGDAIGRAIKNRPKFNPEWT